MNTQGSAPRSRDWARRVRRGVGMFFLWTSGIHVGLVSADPQVYSGFADDALLDFVANAWQEWFMAEPRLWGLLLAAGEALLGALLLGRGAAVRIGWVGVIAFHALLVLFGWGLLAWSAPALMVLVPAARRDWKQPRYGGYC